MDEQARFLDRITIRDLSLRCIIGINDDERREKQDVMINLVLFADLTAARRSDDIADTVDYKKVKKRVLAVVENSRFFLVERLAECIADVCLEDERVLKVRVLVEKPGVLRFARTVGVEIEKERPRHEP